MSHTTFQKLLFMICSSLHGNESMGKLSKRPAVITELGLAIFLRMMAGASASDVMTTYRVSRSAVFSIFHKTKNIINETLSLPGLPDDFEGYRKKANDFQTSRSPPRPLHGCVGALDGISVKIKNPSEEHEPAQYYIRKGYYSIPVQALCDSQYNFMCYSAKCVGSTHDALAHSVTALGQFLDDGNLPGIFGLRETKRINAATHLLHQSRALRPQMRKKRSISNTPLFACTLNKRLACLFRNRGFSTT